MRTLHVGLRVSDLERSLTFYAAVGYAVVGTVEGTAFGSLSMLQLPGDHFVTIELVHDQARGKADLGTGISHLVIQVESLDVTLADLAAKGIADGPRTSWITDPDGYRIELVQWPRPRRWHHQGRLHLSRPARLKGQPLVDRDRYLPSPSPHCLSGGSSRHLRPAIVTHGHGSAKARVAISPITQAWFRRLELCCWRSEPPLPFGRPAVPGEADSCIDQEL